MAKKATTPQIEEQAPPAQSQGSAGQIPKSAPAKKVQLINVRSTLKPKPDGGNPVALREVNPKHPGGEAFVAGPKPVEVALTAEVQAKLREGVLEEVDE